MRKVLVFALLALAVIATGIVTATKYDEWFVYPGLIQSKRGHVIQNLRDPATVQFKNEQLTRFGWLCGEMNSKNAYGAYAGFKRFMSLSYDAAYVEGTGYAGKSDARSTRQIVEDLEAKTAVLRNLLVVAKAHPELSKPSQEEIDAMADRAIFKKQWEEHCT